MRAVYGLYEAFLSPEFFLERGKLYDADDPSVTEQMRRHPGAFTDNPARAMGGVVEQATAAPGEKRATRRA